MTFLNCCRLVTSDAMIVQSLGTLGAQVTEQVSPGISSLPIPAHRYSVGASFFFFKGNTCVQFKRKTILMYLSRDILDIYKQYVCVCVCVFDTNDSTHSTLHNTLLFSLNNISASTKSSLPAYGMCHNLLFFSIIFNIFIGV